MSARVLGDDAMRFENHPRGMPQLTPSMTGRGIIFMVEHKTKPIRVLLVSEQMLIRVGLRMLIGSKKGFNVVGEASGHPDALILASRVRPDIILVDIDTHNGNGIHLLGDLAAHSHKAHLITLASGRNPEAYREAMTKGAVGLVLKEQPPETLFKALEKVHKGEAWLDVPTMSEILARMARAIAANTQGAEAHRIKLLTTREREIIARLAEGMKNKAIASKLFISEATVRHHLSSVFSKLGVADRTELVIYAFRHGLAEVPR